MFYKRPLSLLLLFFNFAVLASAQEKIVEEWIQNDIEATKLVLKLSQTLPQDEEKIAEIIGSRVSHDPVELGFGARKIEESQGHGYTSIVVSAFFFKDKIIKYRITLGNSSSWLEVRERIIEAWKQNVRLPFEEYDIGIFYEVKNDSVLEEYKQTVGKELGELNQVNIPSKLKEDYEYLISPMKNSAVSKDACGVAGMILQGKESIDLVVKSKRIDLLENILRGYNPGGRIYALIAFLKMEKREIHIERKKEVKPLRKRKRKAVSKKVIEYQKEKREL